MGGDSLLMSVWRSFGDGFTGKEDSDVGGFRADT